MKVLVHEHVSGGGLAGSALPTSWLAEGSAMRRALARDFAAVAGVRVVMSLDPRLPDEPGPWTTVRPGDGTSVEAVAARVDHTILIAPETDGVLLTLTEAVLRSGGHPLGSAPEVVALAGDKLRLADHLATRGIPTPPSLRVDPRGGLPRDADYPAILKPIDGAGSLDTLLVASPDDPIVASFPYPEGLLQPFLDGEPRSATFLCRRGRPPALLGVARQAIDRVGGRFAYRGGAILDDELPPDHPAFRAVGSVPGLAGLVGVDYLDTGPPSRSVVIEINPRPTTTCVGLVAVFGPGRLASAWLDRAEPPSPPDRGRAGHPLAFGADGLIHAPAPSPMPRSRSR